MARPKGSTNTKTIQHIEPSRCPNCASTRRGRYTNRNIQDYSGLDADGRPFTAIIRHRCQCLDCGQYRIDQTYWYSLTPPADDEADDQEPATADTDGGRPDA